MLVALADKARPDGCNSRPSVATLVKMTGFQDRAVRGALQRLEGRDLIRAIAYPKGGGGKATVWCLVVANAAGDADLNAAGDAGKETATRHLTTPNAASDDANAAGDADHPLEPSEPTTYACPSCNAPLRDLRETRRSSRSPMWRCSNRRCAGSAKGGPWVSWDAAPPGDSPLDAARILGKNRARHDVEETEIVSELAQTFAGHPDVQKLIDVGVGAFREARAS